MALSFSKTYSFNLDFAKEGILPDFDPVTSEYNVFILDMNIKHRGATVDLTDINIEIHYLRPDTEVHVQTDNIEVISAVGGKAKVVVNNVAFAKAGEVSCEVVLKDSTGGSLIVSPRLDFEVRDAIYDPSAETTLNGTPLRIKVAELEARILELENK